MPKNDALQEQMRNAIRFETAWDTIVMEAFASTPMTETTLTNIQLSDSAARRIAFLATTQPKPGAMLRISVEGGGCSGFQYKYEFVWDQGRDDAVLEKHGAKVLIDSTSQELMGGTVIDFEETLGGAAFAIKNPNATANCGCGNSFSV